MSSEISSDGFGEADGMHRGDVFPDERGLPTFAFISDFVTYPNHRAVEDLYDRVRTSLGQMRWGDYDRLAHVLATGGYPEAELDGLSAQTPEAAIVRTLVQRGAELLMENIEMRVYDEMMERE